MRHHQAAAAAHAVSHLPSAKILTPEKRLMLAILRNAVACLKKGFTGSILHCSRPARETIEWIQHPGQEWVFSFEVICDALNLDAAALRQGLLGTGLSQRLNERGQE